MEERKKLLEIENLKKYFPVKAGFGKKQYVQAVESVSCHIYEGETLGLVGESGCGKTTLGRTIIRLHEPTSGKIVFDGTPIYDSEKKIAVPMLPYRRKMQIIFQDPSASLDPRMTVGEIVGEALDIHGLFQGKAERRERSTNCWMKSASTPSIPTGSPTSSPVVSSSASASPARWRWNPSSSCATNPFPRWTYPSSPRSSTCWKTCRRTRVLRICSSPTTSPS